MSKRFLSFYGKKSIFAVIALILIAATSVGALSQFFPYIGRRLGLIDDPPSAASSSPKISTAKEYPFPEGSAAVSSEKKASVTDRITNAADSVKELINTYASDENPLAPIYYKMYGVTNRLLDRNIIENSEKNVFRIDGNKLVFADKFQPAQEAYGYISDFADWLKSRGTDFLYVIPASKSDDSLIEYPEGFESGYGQRNEDFLSFLEKNDISYLDTRELLLSTGKDYYSWFYNTDHHWTVRAGIMVADRITERMADDFGFDIDTSVCDIENYESKVYPKALLGSIGRKVSLGYTDAENLEILYPSFETDFDLELPEKGASFTGVFGESLIVPSSINGSYYSSATAYSAFMHGDTSLIRVKNGKCSNGIRVLVLKESKANVINPYLACAVEYLDIIDPRWFGGSIRTFIEKTDPDLVFICSTGPASDSDTTWTLK